jgi:hypothetical protein
MDPKRARLWFLATAACVLVGIVIQLFVSANNEMAFGSSPLTRALNIFVYFTIDSNLLVGVSCLLLAIDPRRSSTVFAVIRMMGLVGIAVTGLVFHVVLSRLLDLDSWAQVANQLQHTVVPVLAVTGWIMLGPRGLTSPRIARLTVIFPLAYMAFTVIRGPLASDFYPYPFADAKRLGYLAVTVNAFWVALLFVVVAAAATAADRKLGVLRFSPDIASSPNLTVGDVQASDT